VNIVSSGESGITYDDPAQPAAGGLKKIKCPLASLTSFSFSSAYQGKLWTLQKTKMPGFGWSFYSFPGNKGQLSNFLPGLTKVVDFLD
jgi:hypothetical protein